MLKNCKTCGMLFVSSGTSLCEGCMHEAFTIMRDYLTANPGAGIVDLIRDTALGLGTIDSILADGRIQIG